MRACGTVLVIAAFLTVSVSLAAESPPKLDFAIKDQFGTLHTGQDCGTAVVLMLGGGRKGITYIDVWGSPLHAALEEELDAGAVCSLGFAHLKGVPFFIKKKVVDSFSKNPEEWTLLDWKGHIAKSWGAEKDAANLYLFDRNGRLILHEALYEYDEELLDRIIRTTLSTVEGK